MNDIANSPEVPQLAVPRPPAAVDNPPGLDLDRLADYLDRTAPGIIDRPFTAEAIVGGKSNLTYILHGAVGRVVLRRPPLGHLLPTAHDMSRDYKAIAALHPTGFPVPVPLHLCEDPEVIGAPFYVMSYVDGRTTLTYDDPAMFDRSTVVRIDELLVDTLARLHAIVPAAVGLADFGRPEGYLERQVRRMYQQWERSKTRELPQVEQLMAALTETLPTPARTSIVHGDYGLHNVIFDAEIASILAVVDWEIATLGDPLADLGYLMALRGLPIDAMGTVSQTTAADRGFLSPAELAQRYAVRMPEASLDGIAWYLALAYYKMAVTWEGVHARYQSGQIFGEGFDFFGANVPTLIDLAGAALAE